ncbi:hypothetical protein FF2_046076 [Malus domestica]
MGSMDEHLISTFSLCSTRTQHSNSHRKVLELRRQNEASQQQAPLNPKPSYKSGPGSQSPSSLSFKPSSPPVSPAHRQQLQDQVRPRTTASICAFSATHDLGVRSVTIHVSCTPSEHLRQYLKTFANLHQIILDSQKRLRLLQRIGRENAVVLWQ